MCIIDIYIRQVEVKKMKKSKTRPRYGNGMKNLTLRVEPDIRHQLEADSIATDTTVSEVIRTILDQHYAKKNKKKK